MGRDVCSFRRRAVDSLLHLRSTEEVRWDGGLALTAQGFPDRQLLNVLQKEWANLTLSDSQLRTVVRRSDLVRLEALRLRAGLLLEEESNEKEKRELEEPNERRRILLFSGPEQLPVSCSLYITGVSCSSWRY